MTANVLEHRRAKAFAEALEAHQAERSAADGEETANTAAGNAGSAAMAELIDTVGALRALPAPELDREVRTVQRAQLMAAFEQAFAGGPGATVPRQRRHRTVRTAPRGRWSRRFAIGGLVAGLAVGSFAGAAAASGNALPGDPLYGMKRGLEGLRLNLAESDSERGELLLDNAATRLGEARSLVGRAGTGGSLSPGTVDQVRKALDDMHADALKGRDLLRAVYRNNGSLDPMRALAGFAQDEDGTWAEVQSRLPVQLIPQAHLVDQLFDDISQDVAPLRLVQQPAGSGTPTDGGAGDGTRGQGTGGSGGPSAGTAPDAGRTDGGAPAQGGVIGGLTGTVTGGRPGGLPLVPPQGGVPAPAAPAAPGAPAAPAPSADAGVVPGPVGGLVDNLTSGLTGTRPSPSADAPAPVPAPDQSPAPTADAPPSASSGATQQGVEVPPLIPGLLPGLRILGG
ncbi:DUF5667 domain-containing protein [Kitasatospora sp. NPDC056327]|uniref:DUF5667 domain-containing protein n=1 Tax=Kitasatospora sp. NPDC056327 TaxID=3345785 RepID=UPI0035E04FE9